jgi:hypothetical protein
MRGFDVANVGDTRIGPLALEREHQRRHGPPRQSRLSPVGAVSDDLLAEIAARHIVDHLERRGIVVMRRRDEQWGNASDVGKGGNASS